MSSNTIKPSQIQTMNISMKKTITKMKPLFSPNTLLRRKGGLISQQLSHLINTNLNGIKGK